jgi:hypothetical protein
LLFREMHFSPPGHSHEAASGCCPTQSSPHASDGCKPVSGQTRNGFGDRVRHMRALYWTYFLFDACCYIGLLWFGATRFRNDFSSNTDWDFCFFAALVDTETATDLADGNERAAGQVVLPPRQQVAGRLYM